MPHMKVAQLLRPWDPDRLIARQHSASNRFSLTGLLQYACLQPPRVFKMRENEMQLTFYSITWGISHVGVIYTEV